MVGYVDNIENRTVENSNFRKILFTGPHMQLVLMSLKPGEDIGEEVHPKVDQFFRVEQGEGKIVMDGEETEIKDDFVVIVPAGVKHNLINTSESQELKMYTIYTPPNHIDGIVHSTKEDAMADEEDEKFSESVNA